MLVVVWLATQLVFALILEGFDDSKKQLEIESITEDFFEEKDQAFEKTFDKLLKKLEKEKKESDDAFEEEKRKIEWLRDSYKKRLNQTR
ncbi:hypothetical protein RFI_15101 [Reticulomyxa filosa]|uniref:Uncharacterized protein n=1 Tax=Reticulomyxa filosa TaxID=46433 RepID=X6N857_RETFI|nr:hypothetical protein RFI_15101 [Reticulomyxa filosa]|eukprot:ETO22103.1 hypothetical protein RFI_15101 [Reticulomyxa filosa]